MSDGRFILGLGASGPQVIEGFHGVPYEAPLGRTREIIDICRMVWKREKLVYDGKYYTLPLPPEQGTGLGKPLKIITHPVRDSIPIYVASLGPKNVEMTAELADGWLPLFYIPERAKDVWGDDLAAGVRQALARRSARSTSWPAAWSPSARTRPRSPSSPARWSPSTSAAWGPRARTSTTTWPAATATRRRPRRSRTSTSTARRTRPRPRSPTSCWPSPTCAAPRAGSRSASPPSRRPASSTLNLTPIGPDATDIIEKIKAWSE